MLATLHSKKESLGKQEGQLCDAGSGHGHWGTREARACERPQIHAGTTRTVTILKSVVHPRLRE